MAELVANVDVENDKSDVSNISFIIANGPVVFIDISGIEYSSIVIDTFMNTNTSRLFVQERK
jgi:hypothetical protein